jgi:hypothetical protein
MSPRTHAILSASSSERWIHCPPSVRLGERFDDQESAYALEGTCAHALAEYKLRRALGYPAEDPTENLDFFNEEMDDATDGYVSFVLEQREAAKKACRDPKVYVEQRVDFSNWVKDGFGTADALIAADGTLRIIDLKYGTGIEVNAENNTQLACYALGAIAMFDGLYDIDTVSLSIYQPRRQNVSIWEISKDDLLSWAKSVLKPAAELAFTGAGDYSCGYWCRFCKARMICRKRAEENLKLAQDDFKLPPELSDAEIEVILSKVDELTVWASDIKEYALQQALSGKEWRGFKLVEGRSIRKYTDEASVAKAVTDAGYDPYQKKLLGITAMQRLLGKSRFNELLSAYIEKPQGKPTLVPDSDKRPAMNTAKNDFMEEKYHE